MKLFPAQVHIGLLVLNDELYRINRQGCDGGLLPNSAALPAFIVWINCVAWCEIGPSGR